MPKRIGIKSGELRHEVIAVLPESTQDEFGEQGTAISVLASVWASIRPREGSEIIGSQEVQAQTTHDIVIRYLTGIDAKHQILYGARTFEIKNVRNVYELDHKQVLECKEITT